jgi:MoxR-like ATPase
MRGEIMRPLQYYRGSPETPPPESPVTIPSLVRDTAREAVAYKAVEGLVDAVNVALILSQPLLLTGEPGTGKTQLAYSLGRELGYEVRKFETKSTSVARELFYTYDTLRRFHDAQVHVRQDSREYITYNALGIAILQTEERSDVEAWLPTEFQHNGPQRSIVLIDEIDKAPRDFPNDLLNEIEGLYFRIPELGLVNERIEAKEELRPVVIITSNSEKSLPAAFLRRCIFYDIPFPDDARLMEIVLSHMTAMGASEPAWLKDAIEFFFKLRSDRSGLDKNPATAELLNWISYLRNAKLGDEARLRAHKDIVSSSLSVLSKSESDQERANSILKEWLHEP